MAKGMKMGSCRKLNCGNEIFALKQLSKEDKGKLICRFCSAKVVYVSSSAPQSSKKKVPAYLRLWPQLLLFSRLISWLVKFG